MTTTTSKTISSGTDAADLLVPLIRTAATIAFAISPCSLGFVIIAMSEQLIRCIMVGEDPEVLVSELQQRFPNAPLKISDGDGSGMFARVVDLIDRPQPADELPLDVRGTDFQMHVWEELHKVPAGSTVNYTFLAEQIGAGTVGASAQAGSGSHATDGLCYRAVCAEGALAWVPAGHRESRLP